MANISSGATAPTSATTMPTLVAPTLPITPAETASFMTQGNMTIDAAVELMKSCDMESDVYNYLLDFAQGVADQVLDEEVRIADKVRALGPTKGSGAAVRAARAKKDTTMKAHGLKKR